MPVGSSVNCFISEEEKNGIIEYLKNRSWKLASVLVTGEHPDVKQGTKEIGDMLDTLNSIASEYELDKPFTITIAFI